MSTATSSLDIAPLSGTIGAEIRNVDLHQPLDPSTVAAIRQALLDYKVIFLPGQHLSPAEHKEFALYFGEITNAHPVVPGIEEHREVFEIDYTKARELYGVSKAPKVDRTEYETSDKWHTDVTFVETPPLGSILNALVIPEAGGDTLWADTNAAYEGLSQPIKDLVDGLTAIHDGTRQFGRCSRPSARANGTARTSPSSPRWNTRSCAPTPRPGRRSLFVNPGFTLKIKGLTGKESDALLQFLYAHMATPEYIVRYRWEAGDLGFWDNRTTMHYAITRLRRCAPGHPAGDDQRGQAVLGPTPLTRPPPDSATTPTPRRARRPRQPTKGTSPLMLHRSPGAPRPRPAAPPAAPRRATRHRTGGRLSSAPRRPCAAGAAASASAKHGAPDWPA